MGHVYYAALKHLVYEKVHSRNDKGRKQALNRQATEGKPKNGGHRLGHMERDAIHGHGAAYFEHERMISPDRFVAYVDDAGALCFYDNSVKEDEVDIDDLIVPEYESGGANPVKVLIPYSLLLFLRECTPLGIRTIIETRERAPLPWSRHRNYLPRPDE